MWPTKSEELWKAVVERSEARDSKKPTKLNEEKQKKSENEKNKHVMDTCIQPTMLYGAPTFYH